MTADAQLFVGYDAAVEAILAESASTAAGDSIRLNIYLLEPGDSSQRVLDALAAAAQRGVDVEISIDYTLGSHVSRFWERTQTWIPRALELAREHERITARARRVPDHSKYLVFQRAEAASTAVLGGVNLGDRFQPWQDFMVRIEGQAGVDALLAAVAGEGPALPDVPPPDGSLAFAANAPGGRFAMREAYEALFSCSAFTRYRVAMAYLDTAGARLIELALERGAELELLMAEQANVYQHANRKALGRLLRASDGARAWLCPDMLHAKCVLAEGPDGLRAGFLGSANLKRNSFRLFGELNVLVRQASFTDQLSRALDELWAPSRALEGPPGYNRGWAVVEERFG
jgi:phosphatidylserine/phosphatidylglycerophosphate/cardiolipin synthase-like enzyme